MIERYPMEPSTASFHGCSAVARAIAGTVFGFESKWGSHELHFGLP